MATPIDKEILSAEERQALAPKLRCPRCGFEAQGVRCPRCDAVKVVGCNGSCGSCRTGCAARKKG